MRVETIRFASLGSGSGGNGTVVQGGGTTVLVDCGFSVKQTTGRLKALGVAVETITGIMLAVLFRSRTDLIYPSMPRMGPTERSLNGI